MTFTIASIGSMVIDVAVFTPRVPLTGENFVAHGVNIGPGGKGANAAAAIARLGAQSLMIGKLGDDDFGRIELNALKNEQVDTSAIGIDPALKTGTALIMVNDQKENTILVVMAANDHVTGDYVATTLAAHKDDLDAILVDFEIPESGVAAAVTFGHEHRIPVIVDAGPPRPYPPAVWGHCTVMTPNEHEAAAMVGYTIDADADALRAARELLDHGPEMVVLKRGKRGALIMTRTETHIVPPFAIDAVDTTGAGDAFTAMFIVAMLEKMSPLDCVRYGNAAGAIAASRVGTLPSLPNRAEVKAFLAAHA